MASQAMARCNKCGSNCLAQFLKAGAIPVGAGLPANTGEARAIHHGVGFAGKPASTRLTLRTGFKLYFQAAVALDRAMMYPF